MKSVKKKLGGYYPFVCMLVICAVLWLGLFGWHLCLNPAEPADFVLFTLIVFYGIHPLSTFVFCLLLGKKPSWVKWIGPILFTLFAWTLTAAVSDGGPIDFPLITLFGGLLGLGAGQVWYLLGHKDRVKES